MDVAPIWVMLWTILNPSYLSTPLTVTSYRSLPAFSTNTNIYRAICMDLTRARLRNLPLKKVTQIAVPRTVKEVVVTHLREGLVCFRSITKEQALIVRVPFG